MSMNQGFLTGFFKGSSQTAILGLVSIFYSLALGVIPFIAKRLISGDVGATAYALLKTAAIATGAAVSAVAGVGAGFGAERCRRRRSGKHWLRSRRGWRSKRRNRQFFHCAARAEHSGHDPFRP